MGKKQHAKKKSECVKAAWWLGLCIAKYSMSTQWSRILHFEYKHVQFFNNVVNKVIRILVPQSVFLPTCFLNTRNVTRNAENLNYIVLSFVSKKNKRVNFWLLHILLSFYVRKKLHNTRNLNEQQSTRWSTNFFHYFNFNSANPITLVLSILKIQNEQHPQNMYLQCANPCRK